MLLRDKEQMIVYIEYILTWRVLFVKYDAYALNKDN